MDNQRDDNGEITQNLQPTYTTNPYQVVSMPITQESTQPTTSVQSNPEGRPSSYKEEYCKQVIEHMEKGYSLESFGAIVNVHKDTLYEWQKSHEEFSDAVKVGYAKSLLWWEQAGMQGMLGLPIVYKDKHGQIRTAEKGINASVYALQMANKHKWRTGREDITSDDKKVETTIIYKPEKVEEGAEE